jgi:hypothetical protein
MKLSKSDIGAALILKFPDAPTKTLARILYRYNSALFSSLDAARNVILYLRGVTGQKSRNNARFPKEPCPPGDPFSSLPTEIKSFDTEWGAVTLDGQSKCLVMADVHIPFYDKSATISAIEYGVSRNADTIILMGDIADCFSVSFWETDPRRRDFPGEIKSVKEFLSVVRKKFKSARITYKLGNHEDRLERYMSVKAPELLGVPEFSFENLFGLRDLQMDLVGDNRPLRLGNLNMIHGHEYKFAISNPVNPARGLFLRGKSHAACFHFHQTSQHSEKSLEQKVVSTWSGGALCDLHPSYRPLNNWNHGFMFIEVDKNGAFQVENLRIVHGSVYH